LRIANPGGGTTLPPHPARLAHLGQHGRELVLFVQRVVPAQEPDAGTGKDFYQRFKHLPPILMRCACPPFWLVAMGRVSAPPNQINMIRI